MQGRQSDSVRATHVLNRLTFGARPGDLDRVLSMGIEKWIDEQLRPDEISDSATAEMLAGVSGNGLPGQLLNVVTVLTRKSAAGAAAQPQSLKVVAVKDSALVMMPKSTDSAMVRRVRVLLESRRPGGEPNAIARVARASATERQLLEVVTDFWTNHFSVFRGKMPSRTALQKFENDIRPFAFGKFRDLLGAVAHSPAMLFYLDNNLSFADSGRMTLPEYESFVRSGQRPVARRKTGLNENYARELLELHTLGVDGGYTQSDVIEVARALTGWGIATPLTSDSFAFNRMQHDAEEKVVLGTKLAAGRGIEDGEEVLDLVARHPSTARFIARKLAVRLVSDAPPQSLIDRAAEVFTRTDGDIREVVRTIVTSPEFFSADTFRAKVKSPFEFVMSMRRALSASPDLSPTSALLVAELNQSLWGKETPDGWPETGSPWMTSGAMFNRVGMAMRVARGEVAQLSPDSSATWRELAEAPFQKQMDAVVKTILAGTATPATIDALRSIGAAQSTAAAPGTKETLQQLIAMALSSPEFQRR
jgi:uncharacterized protein (DUF1800 family)